MQKEVAPSFSNYDYIIFDLDNTLYHRGKPIKERMSLLRKALSMSKKVFFLTNSAARTRAQIQGIFLNEGIELALSHIITGNELIEAYTKEKGLNRPYIVGSAHITSLGNSREKPDVVVVTYLPVLKTEVLDDLKKLRDSVDELICVDKSAYLPTDGKVRCGSYWLVKAVEDALGKECTLLGKPSTYPAKLLPPDVGKKPTLVIGDSSSDEAFAKKINAEFMAV